MSSTYGSGPASPPPAAAGSSDTSVCRPASIVWRRPGPERTVTVPIAPPFPGSAAGSGGLAVLLADGGQGPPRRLLLGLLLRVALALGHHRPIDDALAAERPAVAW